MSGYHLNNINIGKLGEWSKVIEEVEEFEDACEQQASIMSLMELSDIIGAIKFFCMKNQMKVFWNDYEENLYPYMSSTSKNEKDLNNSVSFQEIVKSFKEIKIENVNYGGVKTLNKEELINTLNLVEKYVNQYSLGIVDLILMLRIKERVLIK